MYEEPSPPDLQPRRRRHHAAGRATALAVAVGVGVSLGVAGREPLARAWDGLTGRADAAQVSAIPTATRTTGLGSGAADALAQPGVNGSGEGTIIRVAQQVSPAVVLVERQGASGSGVIARRDGVVLTNAHVVGDAQQVFLTLADGRRLPARVLGDRKSVV